MHYGDWNQFRRRAIARDYETPALRCSSWAGGPIGFPIVLNGGALNLEIILGRQAPKCDVRHIDGIVLTF